MIAEGVPYQVLGTKFFDRKEVKDILFISARKFG
jgi:superfamily I DNA/RNA helicase